MYRHLTLEECAARYPRLVRAMKSAAILATTEAGAALRDYRDAHEALTGGNPYSGLTHYDAASWRKWGRDMMRYGGGEAVAHFGGPRRVIERAVATRNYK